MKTVYHFVFMCVLRDTHVWMRGGTQEDVYHTRKVCGFHSTYGDILLFRFKSLLCGIKINNSYPKKYQRKYCIQATSTEKKLFRFFSLCVYQIYSEYYTVRIFVLIKFNICVRHLIQNHSDSINI